MSFALSSASCLCSPVILTFFCSTPCRSSLPCCSFACAVLNFSSPGLINAIFRTVPALETACNFVLRQRYIQQLSCLLDSSVTHIPPPWSNRHVPDRS